MSTNVHFENRDRPLEAGDKVGDYIVEEPIGSGSFGVVYRAIQPAIGKPVAVKVLAHRFSSDPTVLSRFILEARAVNQIQNRNIIDIFSFGQLPDGRHYHVMELLLGQPLSDYLSERGERLTLDDAFPILRGIARALDAAHKAGIVHRDLKPANVFITSDDEDSPFPKLLDFGIAKLLHNQVPQSHQTATGAAVGTPDYMSPEQCRGRMIDHRSDIYAFGLLTFRLITGRLPFKSESVIESMVNHLTKSPAKFSEISPEYGDVLDGLFDGVLAKEPSERPATARGFLIQLDEVARSAGLAVSAQKLTLDSDIGQEQTSELISFADLPQKRLNGGRRSLWLVGLVILVCSVIAGLYVGPGARASRWLDIWGESPVDPSRMSDHDIPSPDNMSSSPQGNTESTTSVGTSSITSKLTAVPQKVSLRFKGEPKGADIYDTNGQRLGSIPSTLQMPKSLEFWEVHISAEGYRSQKRRIQPVKDLVISVQLKKIVKTTKPSGLDTLEVPEW